MWFGFGKKKEASENDSNTDVFHGVYLRDLVSIRMEAIGGQGANSAGKILAESAVLGQGYSGNHFSSFGSEKRGSPVKSFVRFSPKNLPIRSATAVLNPDLLIVFHESLLHKHADVLAGVGEQTKHFAKSCRQLFFSSLRN